MNAIPAIPKKILKAMESAQAHAVQSVLSLDIVREGNYEITKIREGIILISDEFRQSQIYVDKFGVISGNPNIVSLAQNSGITLF